jgi:hypothetical protein
MESHRGSDSVLPGTLAGLNRQLETARVVVARPAGVGRAITTYDMLIEGRDEWLAAAARQLT